MIKRTRKWSEHDLVVAVKDSFSLAQVISKIGLKPAGGNYALIKKVIDDLKLDTSHFTGQLWNKGKSTGVKKELATYLVYSDNLLASSHRLKLRLLTEGVKLHICEDCGLTQWKEQPIPLELHHISGNRQDNRLENLQLLCPNCHALTDNYRGKNKK